MTDMLPAGDNHPDLKPRIGRPPGAKTREGRGKFNEAQIREALLTLAIHGGNSERAAEQLNNQGISITARTLRNWIHEKHTLYMELYDKHGRDIENAVVPKLTNVMLTAAEGTQLAVDASVAELQAGNVKNPSSVAYQLALVQGIAQDKLLRITGRPTQITENRDVTEIFNSLAHQLNDPRLRADAEGTAEDISDTTVPVPDASRQIARTD